MNYRSEHTIPLLFKPYFSTYFTPPDYPIYYKDGIDTSSFCLGLFFTSLIGCFKHHLFFQLLWGSTFFCSIWSWKTLGINFEGMIGYHRYDRCTPFSVIFTLIDHPCFEELILRGNSFKIFLIFLIFLPLEIWQKLYCHNFETIFNTCERGDFHY